jgi:hypothetical protein
MERGTDEELDAVSREWRALAYERRLTTRLLVGVSLVFVGVVAALVLVGLPLEACVYAHGLYAENCTTGRLGLLGQLALLGVATGSLAVGGWLSWGSLRGLRGDGRHA